MKQALSIAVILVSGCGSSSPRVAPPASGGACPEAYFAVDELEPPACATKDGCVKIYQVTSDCTVTLRNTVEGATGTVVWPSARGDLILYESLVPEPPSDQSATLRQMVIASPLTTRAVTQAAWKDITFGERDPEGALDWDFVSDGEYAYAIGCGEWDQGEEDWSCSSIEYLRHDGHRDETMPLPAMTRAFGTGTIADGVSVVSVGGDLMCKAGGEPVELSIIAGRIVATSAWYGDHWFVYREVEGTRTSTASGFMLEPMKGCQAEPQIPGWYIPGPGGLAAKVTPVGEEGEVRTRIHLKGAADPLTTADGKPFEVEGEIYWTAP